MLGLASCSRGVGNFVELVNESEPTKISTVTSFNDGERTLSGQFETIIDGSDFELTYSYQRYATPAEGVEKMDPDNFVTTDEGTVYYKDGKYSKDGEEWFSAAPDAATKQIKFSISRKNLGDYTVSKDGKTITATVTSEQAEAMLGVNVEAVEDVEITIKHDGTYLRSIQVYYVTENAEAVTISTSYSYISASEPELPESEESKTEE